MSRIWWLIGGIVVLGLLSGNKNNRRFRSSGRTMRVNHPHVIDDDDYECPVCGRRFREDQMFCPYCDAQFDGKVTDTEEWDEEEDEMEAWDEEDGV